MPWQTPSLRQVREIVRDDIVAALLGAAMVGNSAMRVMADANAGLAHLTLRYIDWLARQFLPDTAETEWLDRHGDIWLVNADSTVGRKQASMAHGTADFTGIADAIVPAGTRLGSPDGSIEYETTNEITIGDEPTNAGIIALDGGEAGNLVAGEELTLPTPLAGVDSTATVVVLEGGTDEENDDDLRTRVLLRIQNPPMGGDKTDYVQWALSFPGVTRAWCYPLEMGIGTVTVRFMMDELRVGNGGFPLPDDVIALNSYLATVRPVAVKDFFCMAPIPFPIDLTIMQLSISDAATRAAINVSLQEMFIEKAEPGTTMWRSWIDEAISRAIGEKFHELNYTTILMPAPGYMPALGNVFFTASVPQIITSPVPGQ